MFGKNKEVYVIWILQEVYYLPTQIKSVQFIAYDWNEVMSSERELFKIAVNNNKYITD